MSVCIKNFNDIQRIVRGILALFFQNSFAVIFSQVENTLFALVFYYNMYNQQIHRIISDKYTQKIGWSLEST